MKLLQYKKGRLFFAGVLFVLVPLSFFFQNCQKSGLVKITQLDSTSKILVSNDCDFDGKLVSNNSEVTTFLNSSVEYGQTCQSETRICKEGVLTGSYVYSICQVNAPKACLLNGHTVMHSLYGQAYQNSSVAFGQECQLEKRYCNDGVLSGSYTFQTCAVGAPNNCRFNNEDVNHGTAVNAYQSSSVPYGDLCVMESRACSNGALSGSYNYSSCLPAAPNVCKFNGQDIAHGQVIKAFQNSSVKFGNECVSEDRTCSNGTLSGSYNYSNCNPDAPNTCRFNGQDVAHGQNVFAWSVSTVKFGESCDNFKEERTCDDGALSGSFEFGSCQEDAPKLCKFNGQDVAHGEWVTAYSESSVAYNETCDAVSEKRTCTDGELSGTFTFASCDVAVAKSCLFSGNTYAHGETWVVFKDASPSFTDHDACDDEKHTDKCTDGQFNYPSGSLTCIMDSPKNCNMNGTATDHGDGLSFYLQKLIQTEGQKCNQVDADCYDGKYYDHNLLLNVTAAAGLTCACDSSAGLTADSGGVCMCATGKLFDTDMHKCVDSVPIWSLQSSATKKYLTKKECGNSTTNYPYSSYGVPVDSLTIVPEDELTAASQVMGTVKDFIKVPSCVTNPNVVKNGCTEYYNSCGTKTYKVILGIK